MKRQQVCPEQLKKMVNFQVKSLMEVRLGCSVGGSPTANPQAKPLASKAAKDYVNVGFCGSVAGNLIKLCLPYRAANPSALKGKNKISCLCSGNQMKRPG
jgi:hypothetical protein